MRIKIPWLAVSALIFYLILFLLWQTRIISSPNEIFLFLQLLYSKYGLLGLFVASFLEGIVYLGLYFPGSTIVALSIVLSDGKIESFLLISLIVAVALFITSFVNYFAGYALSEKKLSRNHDRGFLLSCLYPDALAFYFFYEGLNKRSLKNIFFVPIVMFVYGFILAYLFYLVKPVIVNGSENPFIMIGALLIWFFISLYAKNRKTSPKPKPL